MVVTLLCCWLGWESNIVRGRQVLLKELRAMPSMHIVTADEWSNHFLPEMPASPVASVPLVRRWLGDEAIQVVWYARHLHGLSEAERSRMERVLPEAQLLEDLPPWF